MTGIKSILQEKRTFQPPASFAAAVSGRNAYDALVCEAKDDWEGFWRKHAESEIDWIRPFSVVYDGANAPFHKWFSDGQLNISANCLDRHLEKRGEQAAIIAEGDDGDSEIWTYRRLHAAVCRFANALSALWG